jgi:hypothetical protein
MQSTFGQCQRSAGRVGRKNRHGDKSPETVMVRQRDAKTGQTGSQLGEGATLTKTKALAMVAAYTGQTYRRTEIERARADLTVWIETMKSAIPIENKC